MTDRLACCLKDWGIVLQARLRRLKQDGRGSLSMILALALPAITGAALAAVDIGSLHSMRGKLQSISDQTALMAARELQVAGQELGTVERAAIAFATAALKAQGTDAGAQITATARPDRTGIDIRIDLDAKSTLVGYFKPGSSTLSAQSGAKLTGGGSAAVCVLALEPNADRALWLQSQSRITANGCAIYSNSRGRAGLQAETAAEVTAARICSAGGMLGAGGSFKPMPVTDCPPVKDPLAARAAPATSGCPFLSFPRFITGANTRVTLNPGQYCGGIIATRGAQVELRPGVYVMKNGPLLVDEGATLTGVNAGFVFTGDSSFFYFGDDTTISLSAPKSGDMAGLLFFQAASRRAAKTSDFWQFILTRISNGAQVRLDAFTNDDMITNAIMTNNARNLLGTIYLPQSRLLIDANNPIADQSAYTVIIARKLELYSGPNLVLNTNYSATDVPVPEGVGPRGSTVTLSK